MSNRLKPLGTLIHDFDIDEVVLDEKTNTRSLAQIQNDQNISTRQRAALDLVSKPMAFSDVKDDQGRRRFHGAFTGGFSAGYFNTVGSKEGWKPKQFKSTRGERIIGTTQRISDIADEEDLETLRGNRDLIDYNLGDVRDNLADKRGLSVLDMPEEGRGRADQILRIITTIASPSTGIGSKLFNRLRGFTEGCSKLCPDDVTFQSLLCRRRVHAPIRPRKLGPILPPEMCKALGRKFEESADDFSESLRNCTEMTATSLKSLMGIFRNPKVDFSGVGASNGPSALFSIESSPEDRAATLRISYDGSLMPIPDLVPRPRFMAMAHMVTEQMPGEGHRKSTAIVPMYINTNQPADKPPVARTTQGGRSKQGGRGLREMGLGVMNVYKGESDDEDHMDKGEYNFEIVDEDPSQNSELCGNEVDPLVAMQEKIGKIEASLSCIPGFCSPVDPLICHGTNWFDLSRRLNLRAPRGWHPAPQGQAGEVEITRDAPPVTLWKGAAELKEQLMNRFAVSVGTTPSERPSGLGDPKLLKITKRFKFRWKPNALLCEILGFSGAASAGSELNDERAVKVSILEFLNSLKSTAAYIPQFKFPEITVATQTIGVPVISAVDEVSSPKERSLDYSVLYEMASVQQIYDYLRHRFTGYPAKQEELGCAVMELRNRTSNTDPIVVNTSDLLYKLYCVELRQCPHRYEATLGGARCMVETNCGLERASLVVLFFHGMGVSPWQFARVSSGFYEYAGLLASEIPEVAFILPFGTYRMTDNEFGALHGSHYGCYKWWDVFGSRIVEQAEPSPQARGSKEFTEYSPQPTVIMRALPNLTVKRSVSELSMSPNSQIAFDRKTEDVETAATIPGTPVVVAGKIEHITGCALSPNSMVGTPIQCRICCCVNNNNLGRIIDDKLEGDGKAVVRSRSSPGKIYGVDNPEGREESSSAMIELMGFLKKKYEIPMKKIVISGFSQGAMLAADLFYCVKDAPAMLGIFSGAPMCLSGWTDSFKRWPREFKHEMSRVPVFHAHGVNDWVIPIFVGRWLGRFLRRQNLCISSFEFEGEHELPEDALFEFNKAMYHILVSGRTEAPEGFSTVEQEPRIMDTFDKLLYELGYALASCVLPIARRIC